jgi:hypothetical protein
VFSKKSVPLRVYAQYNTSCYLLTSVLREFGENEKILIERGNSQKDNSRKVKRVCIPPVTWSRGQEERIKYTCGHPQEKRDLKIDMQMKKGLLIGGGGLKKRLNHASERFGCQDKRIHCERDRVLIKKILHGKKVQQFIPVFFPLLFVFKTICLSHQPNDDCCRAAPIPKSSMTFPCLFFPRK